jgi:uncharacterized membrane protein YgcG
MRFDRTDFLIVAFVALFVFIAGFAVTRHARGDEDFLLVSHSTYKQVYGEQADPPHVPATVQRYELPAQYQDGDRYYAAVGQDEATVKELKDSARRQGKGLLLKSVDSGWPKGIHELEVADRRWVYVRKNLSLAMPPDRATKQASYQQPAAEQPRYVCGPNGCFPVNQAPQAYAAQPVYQQPVYYSQPAYYGGYSDGGSGSCASCGGGSEYSGSSWSGGGFSGFSGFSSGGSGGCASCGS